MSAATPPTTPPAIAPLFVAAALFFGTLSRVGTAEAYVEACPALSVVVKTRVRYEVERTICCDLVVVTAPAAGETADSVASAVDAEGVGI